MLDDLKVPVLTLIAAGLLLAGLWGANLPKRRRYAQWWSPGASLVLAVVLTTAYVRAFASEGGWLTEVLEAMRAFLGDQGDRTTAFALLSFNLAVLGGYALVKAFVHGVVRAFDANPDRRGPWAWTHRRETGDGPSAGSGGVNAPPRIALRPDWFYPGLLLRTAGWIVGGAALLLAWVEGTIADLPVTIFTLPVVPLLLLLETGWFLHDAAPAPARERFRGEDAGALAAGSFEALWDDYRRRWADRLLASARWTVRFDPAPGAVYRAGPQSGTPDRVRETWNRLLRSGHPLTQTHFEVLQILLEGRDLIVKEPNYADAAPVLFAALEAHCIDGRHVLALVDADRRASRPRQRAVVDWIRDGLNPDADTIEPVWLVATLDEFQRRGELPHVLVATPHELLQPGLLHHDWFDRLGVLLVLNASATALSHAASVRALAHLLSGCQTIVFSDRRTSLESALRDMLGANFEERTLSPVRPEARYALVWRAERSPGQAYFQSPVLPDDHPPLAPEAVLALPAYRAGVRAIRPLGIEELPWTDYLEELAQSTALRVERFRSAALAPEAPSWLTPSDDRPVLLIRDREHNLVTALHKYLPVGRHEVLAHVVAPPYLFRDYFAAHLGYFLSLDNPPRALVPRIAEKSTYAIAYTLLERLLQAPVSERDILQALHLIDPAARVVEDGLQALFLRVFDLNLRALHALHVEETTVFRDGAFRTETAFRLDPDVEASERLHWLRPFEIRDTGNRMQGTILRDHLVQTYLPGQHHAFHTEEGRHGESKSYRIREIQEHNGVVLTDKEDTLEQVTAYRPVLRIALRAADFPEQPDTCRTVRFGTHTLELAHGTGAYEVRTDGYFTFRSDLSRTALDTSYTPCAAPLRRAYTFGQVLRVRVGSSEPLERPDRIGRTLALLLNEAALTFFPENHALLWACSPAEALPGNETNERRPLAHALPAFRRDTSEDEAEDPAVVEVFLFEDAHADLGLVRCCFEEWTYVLQQMEDYLAWVLDGRSGDGESGWDVRVDDPPAFLRYGYAAVPEELDLEGTRALLTALLGGRNPLTAHRRRGPGTGGEAVGPDVRYGARRCDFCGDALPDVHETMEDGRLRCPSCSEDAVDTLEALRAVYAEARDFLVDDLGVQLTRDVTIAFAGASEIAEAQRRRYMPTADVDPRAVGLAVWNGRNDFTVFIENGHARSRTLATVVHELTHIWQFTRLDVHHLHAEHGLLLIEGHATWSETACLERTGADPAYVDRLRKRADVYGNGYRALVRLMEDAGERNAFGWLLDRYRR